MTTHPIHQTARTGTYLFYEGLDKSNWDKVLRTAKAINAKVIMANFVTTGTCEPLDGWGSMEDIAGFCEMMRRMHGIEIALHAYLNCSGWEWTPPKEDRMTNDTMNHGWNLVPRSASQEESIAAFHAAVDAIKPVSIYCDGQGIHKYHPDGTKMDIAPAAEAEWREQLKYIPFHYPGLVQRGGMIPGMWKPTGANWTQSAPYEIWRFTLYDAYQAEQGHGNDYIDWLRTLQIKVVNTWRWARATHITPEAGWLPLGAGLTKDFIHAVYDKESNTAALPKTWQIMESWWKLRTTHKDELLSLIGEYERC